MSELEANKIVRDMLSALDTIGARNGLRVSDFTLSTTPATDFQGLHTGKNKLTAAQEQTMVDKATDPAAFTLVLRGRDGKPVTKEIFILQPSGVYIALQNGSGRWPAPVGLVNAPDITIVAATNARPEQAHRDLAAKEKAAYTLQLRVLNQFGPRAFANKQF